jgi:hypothetical protein
MEAFRWTGGGVPERRMGGTDHTGDGASPADLDRSENQTELVHSFAYESGGIAYSLFDAMWVEDPDPICPAPE